MGEQWCLSGQVSLASCTVDWIQVLDLGPLGPAVVAGFKSSWLILYLLKWLARLFWCCSWPAAVACFPLPFYSCGVADVASYHLPMPDLACEDYRFGLRLEGLTDVDSLAGSVLRKNCRFHMPIWCEGKLPISLLS
ncbi:hypothetical protein Nepgr_027726 [Nepenthes gracilis]|uniref:Uncharacterized protein n=1 Tax=Nepenthes gracilis TaxID=150966 RepID=A0AAD3TB28_NEPGR|nr:hypothetical protein Nepgr_027726 [Nepenthes gracilis]